MNQQQQRVSIGTKIVAVACSFSIPIAVLLYLMVVNINSYIDFGSKEIEGNAYQRPLELLLHKIQDHRLYFTGGASEPERLGGIAAEINQAFDQLAATDRALGVRLQFTEEGLAKRARQHVHVDVVQKEWQQLASVVSASGSSSRRSEIDPQYEHLVSDIRTMITHAGDTSNLILDPDLDSYYLMDVTLLALPQTQERLAKVTAYGRDVLARGNPTPEERVQLAVYAAMLKEGDSDRIEGSTQTALNEDVNFYGSSETLQNRLPVGLKAYRDATARFIDLTQRIATVDKVDIQPQEFEKAGMEAHQASFDYWNIAVLELDRLLETRVASYANSRAQALIWSALAVLAAAVLAFFIRRSITRPLNGLVRSLGPGATLLSTCVERIAESSKNQSADPDEAAIICGELNAHADDMRTAVLELAAHVCGTGAARMADQTAGRKSRLRRETSMPSPTYTSLLSAVSLFVTKEKAEDIIVRQIKGVNRSPDNFSRDDLRPMMRTLIGAASLYIPDPARRQELRTKVESLA